ncbi:MAG: DNA-binding protein [Pseudomonadota bacterium]
MLLATAKDQQSRGRRKEPRPDQAKIAEVRARLAAQGKTLAGWARENDESVEVVSKVLSGKRACTMGDQHRVAVKLGVKDGELTPPASVNA